MQTAAAIRVKCGTTSTTRPTCQVHAVLCCAHSLPACHVHEPTRPPTPNLHLPACPHSPARRPLSAPPPPHLQPPGEWTITWPKAATARMTPSTWHHCGSTASRLPRGRRMRWRAGGRLLGGGLWLMRSRRWPAPRCSPCCVPLAAANRRGLLPMLLHLCYHLVISLDVTLPACPRRRSTLQGKC